MFGNIHCIEMKEKKLMTAMTVIDPTIVAMRVLFVRQEVICVKIIFIAI